MGIFDTTDIIPGTKRRTEPLYPKTGVPVTLTERSAQHAFRTTDIIDRTKTEYDSRGYRVVLSNRKDFEEVIIEEAGALSETYAAYEAWLSDFNDDPAMRTYPPYTLAICYKGEEIVWKTDPFRKS